MKMLRQAVSKTQKSNFVHALEEQVNEILQFTASIPDPTEPSLPRSMSLESVMHHIQHRNKEVTKPAPERFQVRTVSMEEDGLIFLAVLAVVAAIIVMIDKFTGWLSPSSSSKPASSSGGGSSPSSSSSFKFHSTGSNDSYDRIMRDIEENRRRREEFNKRMHDFDRKFRDADVKMRKPKPSTGGGHSPYSKPGSSATWSVAPDEAKTEDKIKVSSIDDVLDVWLKDPENQDSGIYKFLNSTDKLYNDIGSRGRYYESMTTMQSFADKVAEDMEKWVPKIRSISQMVANAAHNPKGYAGHSDIQKMNELNTGQFKAAFFGSGNQMTMSDACTKIDEIKAESEGSDNHKRVRFERLNELFMSDHVTDTTMKILKNLDECGQILTPMQTALAELDPAVKKLESTVFESPSSQDDANALIRAAKEVLDSVRRDILGFIRFIHHLKTFTDLVRRMDSELQRAQTKALQLVKHELKSVTGDAAKELKELQKQLEDQLTINF